MHASNARRKSSSRRNVPVLAAQIEALEDRRMMSTSAPSYLVPAAPGVEIKPLLTVGDSVGGYRMAGIPDGLGAFDNGDGTFTVLMNHELANNRGAVRDHGSAGAFVSKWVIDKATGEVLSGDDLIKQVYLYDVATASYVPLTTNFHRFCSATLAEPTAFYNPATGLGTRERIFTNGEENATGRAFAHVVSTGQSYELPWMGKYAFENVAPSPYAQDRTIVAGTDDSARTFTTDGATDPSEVYFYLGTKRSTGTVIERAGLVGGVLTGLRVAGKANETQVANGDRFELASLGDVSAKSAAQLESDSVAAGVTQFRRVEDAHWDPTNRNVFYFVTTDGFGGSTRLWKLTFADVTRPELGGTIDIAIDSPPSVPGEMFDNLVVNKTGDVLLQEDVGNNAYLGQIFQYDASSRDLFPIARHNSDLFLDTDPVAPGVQPAGDADPHLPGRQGTQDEESSGIIDLSDILGPGHYLVDVQAHFAQPDAELVEGGQLLIINTNAAKATLGDDGVLRVTGTVNDDRLAVTRKGKTLTVSFDGKTLGTFDERDVDSIQLLGNAGDDVITLDASVQTPALLDGGLANDALFAGGAPSILIGGRGTDLLTGGSKDDLLVGGATSLDPAVLTLALDSWAGKGAYAARVNKLRAVFADKLIDDASTDFLVGAGGQDAFLRGAGDVAVDRQANETFA